VKPIPPRIVVFAATAVAVLTVMGLSVWAVAAIPPAQVRHVTMIENSDTPTKRAALINENQRTLVQADNRTLSQEQSL
jgi:hypothetical protein